MKLSLLLLLILQEKKSSNHCVEFRGPINAKHFFPKLQIFKTSKEFGIVNYQFFLKGEFCLPFLMWHFMLLLGVIETVIKVLEVWVGTARYIYDTNLIGILSFA